MKHRYATALTIVVTSAFVISVALAAQDRFALKSANGIAFSEFRGYDTWQTIAVSQPDDAGGCGTSPAPGCIKAILGNPTMIKAYNDGIPANGKPVPDGAMMAKVEWRKVTNPAAPYGVTVPGTLSEVGVMVKDSKRFPDTNGWGYATFEYDASSDTFKPKTSDPSVMRTLCHSCHARGAKARDFVYTSYSKR
jgi:hypothetical protein